ncbi:hypothetical protein ONZ45_g17187 [Pleurotus djamor]|nr:hypothetical protein ONZ45_g17187 [Pleurotus djamor]
MVSDALPPRRAAKAASACISQQLDSSDSESEDHDYSTPISSKAKAKHVTTPKGSGPRKTPSRQKLKPSTSLSAIGRPPASRTNANTNAKKRPRSSSASASSDIDFGVGPSHPPPHSHSRAIFPFPLSSLGASASASSPVPSRPTKKLKLDGRPHHEDAYRQALLIRNTDDEDDEDLPDVSVAFSRDSYMSSSQASLAISQDTVDNDEFWIPPEQDPRLTIPGEAVLALDRHKYWPARIRAYVPPTKRTQKEGKYEVEFLDGTMKTITRKKFYIAEEDGFITCDIGEFTNQNPDAQLDIDFQLPLRSRARSPSPEASDMPPSPIAFLKLPIRAQFAYVKPVLLSILSASYPPALQRHESFIAGGHARNDLMRTASLRGNLWPEDIQELQLCLVDWCLRDEQLAHRCDDTTPAPPALPSPPSPSLSTTPCGPAVVEEKDGVLVCEPRTSPPPNSSQEQEQAPSALSSSTEVPPSPTCELATIRPETRAPGKPLVKPRLHGCEAYEALSQRDRLEYCHNVLLPEAVNQILLWRSGERTSSQVQTNEVEEEWHRLAEERRRERDWVLGVMRLRALRLGASSPSKKDPERGAKTAGGTRTRPFSQRKFM